MLTKTRMTRLTHGCHGMEKNFALETSRFQSRWVGRACTSAHTELLVLRGGGYLSRERLRTRALTLNLRSIHCRGIIAGRVSGKRLRVVGVQVDV